MDQPSAPEAAPAPGSSTNIAVESAHQRDRRREKPQLSCNFCRRRKMRCDRQLPCNTCVNKGIAISCTYALGPQRKDTSSVGERIHQLEALVRSLIQQQQQPTPQTPAVPPSSRFTDSPTPCSFEVTRGEPSPRSVSAGSTDFTPRTSVDEDTGQRIAPLLHSREHATTPTPSEHGSMRMHSHGATYVGSVHWAAVLDSIAELKDHYEEEEEARLLTPSDYSSGPRLLYEPVQATRAEILASIPARPIVDRMVARYFNAQGVVPAILHSAQFLQQYEGFWKNPGAAPFAWIALLFSIMCLSQHQQLTGDPADPDTLIRVHMFRERTVHCLVLGEFTRGGTHVLEAMVHYLACEFILYKDADIGLWLLLGMIVQLALSMGYHRDPRNFPNISPFAGEMRRRLWAAIVQMDLRLSNQMALPRLLKSQQYDTAEPRNLLDSDFDETTVELPPSRPETEVTPVLYGLAKNQIDRISGPISDLIADTRQHPYEEIMELDRKLKEAEASLPLIFKWQPLSQSFMVSPEIIVHRMWLQLAVRRLVIWLHRKYLALSHTPLARYEYSRNTCIHAAIEILEFQELIDEETQPDGQLYSVRWMLSSLLQSVFLLGMSVLCYYMQLAKTRPDVPLDQDTGDRIQCLLRNTYLIWLRSSTVSRDAREAVEHLSLLLGLRGAHEETQEATAAHLVPAQNAASSLDQVAWDAYQECITNFPATFGADFMTLDAPSSSSAGNMFTTDPLQANPTELGV